MDGNMVKGDDGSQRRVSVDLLKEGYHLQLLGHLDLCVIFILLLRQELKIYNLESVTSLKRLVLRRYSAVHNGSNHVTPQTLHEDNGITADIMSLKWNVAIKHVLHRLRKDFGYPKGEDTLQEFVEWKLTEEDYEYCSSCLKREAIGLRCLLRRCICKAGLVSSVSSDKELHYDDGSNRNSKNAVHAEGTSGDNGETSRQFCTSDAAENTANGRKIPLRHSNHINSKQGRHYMTQSSQTYKITDCGKCKKEPRSTRVVAVISPFTYNPSDKHHKGSKKSMKRSARQLDEKHMDLNWESNVELYTKDTFPLESYLGAVDKYGKEVENNGTDNVSINVADRIVELVMEVLSTKNNVIKDKDANELAIAILSCLHHQEMGCISNEEASNDDKKGMEEPMPSSGHSNEDSHNASKERRRHSEYPAFYKKVEYKLITEDIDAIKRVNQLAPFPTMYWLTDRNLVSQISSLEGKGEIARMQDVIDSCIREYERHGSQEARDLLEKLIKDNLSYICRRFELVHPEILRLLYTVLVNSTFFTCFHDSKYSHDKGFYITLSYGPSEDGSGARWKPNPDLAKSTAIMNTIRSYGIGGNKSFVHIKCLHTNLAFALAEGSTLGNMVFTTLGYPIPH